MLPASHLVSQNLPGHGPSDGRCLPCYGVSGRAFVVSSRPSRDDYMRVTQVKVLPLGCGSSRDVMSFICNANSSGQRRNPDFSRQNRHGFSRNKNRHNEDRDSLDNLEDSEIFSSKNGPSSLSGSASPKFQATAAPGRKEREIVEIFRKVQAQLRERAAQKEEKKIEDSQGPNKQNETVDSLLKLLRKHSIQHKKSSNSNSNSRDFMSDQTEQNSSFFEDRSPKDSYIKVKHEVQDNKVPYVSRPVSNFQRRSPVSRFKYQPASSGDETFNPAPFTKTEGERKESNRVSTQTESKSEPKVENEAFISNGGVFEEVSDDEASDDEASEIDESEDENVMEGTDLSDMKLPELRAVAKSRGMKGFSRLKKRELLDLLTSSAST